MGYMIMKLFEYQMIGFGCVVSYDNIFWRIIRARNAIFEVFVKFQSGCF